MNGKVLRLTSLLEADQSGGAVGKVAGHGHAHDRLVLAPDLPLAPALAGAMQAILGHAVSMARRARAQPAYAVHEWRKALRRARALVRLTRSSLADDDQRAIAGSLRAAQRAASNLRDADALLPVVRQLAREPSVHGQAHSELLRVRDRLLESQRRARRANRAATSLGAHVAAIEAAAARYERALPADVSYEDLARGLRRSYRRARRAFQRARSDSEDPAFHDLRKTVKALHYQAELLASAGGQAAEKLRKRLSELAESQGEVTDLMVVRAETDAGAVSIDPILDRLIARRRRPADKATKKLFRLSASQFSKRLLK